MSLKNYLQYNSKKKIYEYLSLSVSEMSSPSLSSTPEAEVVQQMKNCCSTSAHRSYTESSSSTPWTIFAVSTAVYLSRGAHTAPCTSCWLLELPLH